ncbi:MAG: IPTL-CTERM sorting domain-containing protein [Thermodesulfobacteriota bacterium]
MKKFILYALLFVVLLSVSSSSYAIDFIKFGTSHDADFWGTPNNQFSNFPSTVEYLAARGKNQTTSLDLTDENVQDAFNGDFGAFEAIVVSEIINEISPESYALFSHFVNEGGCLILTGSHGNGEDEFLNNTFGYNVVINDTSTDPSNTYAIQPSAFGTQFEGGPKILASADLTTAFGNTPGNTIYSGALGVGVFTDAFGQGLVTAIGWDYCCATSEGDVIENTPFQILNWYEVVNRAFNQCFPELATPPTTIPTLSEWGLIAMAGILGMAGLIVIRRRKATA